MRFTNTWATWSVGRSVGWFYELGERSATRRNGSSSKSFRSRMPCIRVYATGHNTFPRLYLIAAKSGRVKITLFVRPRFIDLAFRHSSVNLVRVSPKRHNGCICPSAQYPLLAVARSMLPNRTFWFLRKNYRVRTLRTDKTVSRQLDVTN